MTIGAILGLLAVNLALVGVGLGLVYALRPLGSRRDILRFAGLGYLLAIGANSVVLTAELVVGIPVRVPTMVLTSLGIGLAGVAVGRARGHAAPALRRPLRVPPVAVITAGAVAVVVVYLEALFRAARLSGLVEWDGWAFWVPKALTIHRYGGLEDSWFLLLPGPSYPPVVPLLEAASFHAMGGIDPVTLHVQFWCLQAGFLWFLGGVLAGRVRGVVLAPSLVAVVVMPDLVRRALDAQADLLVGYLLAAAAVIVLLWLERSEAWQLPAATVLLAGAMLTKREGLLIAACILVAAAVATVRERRARWPRLAAVGVIAFALSLPWRIWFMSKGLPGDSPEAGLFGFLTDLDRGFGSFRLSLETHFLPRLWWATPFLLVTAAALAWLAGRRRLAVYAAGVFALCILAATWVVWSIPELPITREGGVNPIIRLVGSSALLAASLTPLLLDRVLTACGWVSGALVRQHLSPLVAAAVVAVPAISFPAAALLDGGAHFPSVVECRPAARDGEPIRAVFGRFARARDAEALLARVREVGYASARAEPDGCGLVRVGVHGVTSLEGGRDLQREARTVGLEPLLEADS